ncbi:formimidoylglutamase [Agilicoccus flavus]|uniref:formimidoylglutamase n=1 Tax=Agilicoccus flavus TaxID=2775968 RepID=UPI001CF6BE64|nr:formimidoylglutamase [Agilicoccus flavus]
MPRTPVDHSIWTGRNDGDDPGHVRWHQRIRMGGAGARDEPGDVALLGFASDEGVRRNAGRPGAAVAPDELRRALAPLPVHTDHVVVDLGTVGLPGGGEDVLTDGQREFGAVVAGALDAHRLVVALGGGHETAYASYLGWSASARCADARVGVLNLDAHFDLREADRPTSGTPFLQMARAEAAAGRTLRYGVVGISEAANTRTLFDTADTLGVRYLLDRNCQPRHLDRITAFVDAFVAGVDAVHLSIDLDVLPAAQAPGVSAPAAVGVPVEVILEVCRRVALSGRLALVDIVELCPPRDIDGRTARTAARLVHEMVGCLPQRSPQG